MEVNMELLNAWVKMSENIKVGRILKGVSLNEMLIMSCINKNENTTASAISKEIKLLKSQINRSLNELEKKNFISKKVNPDDKRYVCLSLTKQGKDVYKKEHERILKVVSKVRESLGDKKTKLLTKYMFEAIEVLEDKKDD